MRLTDGALFFGFGYFLSPLEAFQPVEGPIKELWSFHSRLSLKHLLSALLTISFPLQSQDLSRVANLCMTNALGRIGVKCPGL